MDENNISKNANPESNPPLPGNAYNNVIVPKKRKLASLSVFDIIAFIGVFVLTYSLIFVVIDYSFSYKTTVVYLCIFALATAFILAKQKIFRKEAILPGVLAILTSLTFALHSNYEINVLSFFMLMYLSGSYCIKMTASNRHSQGSYFYILDVLKCEVLLPIKNVFLPLISLPTLKTEKSPNKKDGKKYFGILLGILLGVPVLLVIIPLLLKGDAAFEGLVGGMADSITKFFNTLYEKWFDDFYLSDYLIFLFPTVIFTPYIYSVMFSFRHGVTNEENKDTSENYKKLRFASSNLIGGFLGIISLVYVIYLLSQLSYFFSAFSGHLPGGMTINVAEYARRGFFEMTKIAGVNFVIIAVSVLFAKRKENGRLFGVVKWFDLFLCAFTIILVSTSISKIALYISSFGLTHKRIYVLFFDIVLIFVFLSVIIRLFKEKFPYMKVIISASCLAVLALGFLNIDGMIAKNNVDLYLSGKTKTIDVSDISELCPAGLESLDRLALCDDKSVSYDAQIKIADIMGEGMFVTEFTCIESSSPFTLDGLKAKKYIEKNKDRFTEYKNEWYSSWNDLYLFLDTKTKVKSITVTDKHYVYDSEKTQDFSNFELVLFKASWNTMPKDTDAIIDNENKEVENLIIIEDENGNKHNLFLYVENDNYDYSCLVKITEDENGFSAKSLARGSVTYNYALATMKEEMK